MFEFLDIEIGLLEKEDPAWKKSASRIALERRRHGYVFIDVSSAIKHNPK